MMDPIDPLKILKRQMVWDIMPCSLAPDVMEMVGLTRGSEEGNIFEHQASHRRLAPVAPIYEAVKTLSELAGEVVAKGILGTHGIDVPEDIANEHLIHYTAAIQQSVVAVIANLVDADVLEIVGDIR